MSSVPMMAWYSQIPELPRILERLDALAATAVSFAVGAIRNTCCECPRWRRSSWRTGWPLLSVCDNTHNAMYKLVLRHQPLRLGPTPVQLGLSVDPSFGCVRTLSIARTCVSTFKVTRQRRSLT
eukprot:4680097-Amphidinium_carterae.1